MQTDDLQKEDTLKNRCLHFICERTLSLLASVCVCVCEQYSTEIGRLRDELIRMSEDHRTELIKVSWNGAGREGVSEGMGRGVN